MQPVPKKDGGTQFTKNPRKSYEQMYDGRTQNELTTEKLRTNENFTYAKVVKT